MCLITDDNNAPHSFSVPEPILSSGSGGPKEGTCLFQRVLLINPGLSYSTLHYSTDIQACQCPLSNLYSSESSLLPSKPQDRKKKKKHIMSFPKGAEFLPAWNRDPSYPGSFLSPWSRDAGWRSLGKNQNVPNEWWPGLSGVLQDSADFFLLEGFLLSQLEVSSERRLSLEPRGEQACRVWEFCCGFFQLPFPAEYKDPDLPSIPW